MRNPKIITDENLKNSASVASPNFSTLKVVMQSWHPTRLIAIFKEYTHFAVSYIVKLGSIFSNKADQSQNHDAMVNRLHRMKKNFQEKETRLGVDPFRRTFLEQTREYFSCGLDKRENSLKARLQWFAGSAWCRDEVDPLLDRMLKASHRRNSITEFDYESDKSELDEAWVPLVFTPDTISIPDELELVSQARSSAEELQLATDEGCKSQILNFDPESNSSEELVLTSTQSQNAEVLYFHPQTDSVPVSACVNSVITVSDLFMSATKYFMERTIQFGVDTSEATAASKKFVEDSFDDLDMSFSAEDLSLFSAAIEGVNYKFA